MPDANYAWSDLPNLTVAELLSLFGATIDELRRREIVRSANNPLSDYAELLFCKAFGWKREDKATPGYDATDSNGVHYQIKARGLTHPSRQLGVIRDLDKHPPPFDQLAGVLMDKDFRIVRAALVPVSVCAMCHRRYSAAIVGGSSCGIVFGRWTAFAT
jgi:hypothetical protein